MSSNAESSHYAKGLLGALPQDTDLEATERDLARIAASLDDAGLRAALRSGAIATAAKVAVVGSALDSMGAPRPLRALVQLLVQQGHFHLLGPIASEFRRVVDQRLGIARAVVRFARTSSAAEQDAVAVAMSQAVGRKVVVEASVDPSLLGGFVARVGDEVFDGSLIRQLARLRGELLPGR